jgi:ketosteroid isomerase-like protein
MNDAVAEIEAMEERRWAAQLGTDLETLVEVLDEELSYTHSNGLVDTKRSFVDALANKTFDYRRADRSDVAIAVVGDAAMVTGRVAMQVAVDKGERSVDLDSRYSAIWVRRGGDWRFLCWQSTAVQS